MPMTMSKYTAADVKRALAHDRPYTGGLSGTAYHRQPFRFWKK